ncbi:MAG: hypothetical protein QNL62_09145 [Gammaproteobacteria bacterium]|nr:hypothetical protein [Gammaproteobacteria bacterium]
MKKLSIAVLLFSLFSLPVIASETDIDSNSLPSYNTGSDWWIEVTPEDPDYDLYKDVELNCFCG